MRTIIQRNVFCVHKPGFLMLGHILLHTYLGNLNETFRTYSTIHEESYKTSQLVYHTQRLRNKSFSEHV